ncbi:hypothetical protein [Streptomyces hygroscopicus]|nr:hypothetical protein [Streptomyces hygroscopicus]
MFSDPYAVLRALMRAEAMRDRKPRPTPEPEPDAGQEATPAAPQERERE